MSQDEGWMPFVDATDVVADGVTVGMAYEKESGELKAEIASLTRAMANAQTVATLRGDLLAERDAEVAMLRDVAQDWKREQGRAERLAGLLRRVLDGMDKTSCWQIRLRDEIRKEIGA